ncbi:peptidase S41 [Candidatus Kuenenbacteria bacterium CG11_big_fil_rev_8_21_14_0_20_37_9]|uniref:Peptidase S41 n=2 Tax=Candidatus Kueneniibacteriota TaxID=1752740 RepID=A0A2M6XS76_9BACT|nr:MAG: hypothetical protein AUJ29_01760 [Candidatus Kuenenbacteria bacterium CG1_02_38_13]PIR05680.1 MAG: peptidase S41 [Candidatus Kuenenbacteria bacterium CG11_big_fil_rev_8_21_14_0_20_37_9]PIU10483.1 MAG: peptidase S41 [Candidatus Kuenenbacteria bacterium CG08_land_8_20_14_0_20_37_23]
MFPNGERESHMPIEHKPASSFFLTRGFFVYALIITLTLSFGIGVIVGKRKGDVNIISASRSGDYGKVTDKEESIPDYLSKDVKFRIFWDIWNEIQNTYIDGPVAETELFYGALSGMVAGLGDPYSVYMRPKVATEYIEELQGRFEGIGCEIGVKNNILTVVSPLSESPAEHAGLRPADLIIEIDGYSTDGIDVSEAVSRIRGEKGTTVSLKIYRPQTKEFLDISIVRDTINIVSVKNYTLDQNNYAILGDKKIKVIKVTNFNADTDGRFADAINNVLLENPDGLVLDLRGNPGGYLDSAINMADFWLEQGDIVVSERSFGESDKIHLAPSGAVLSGFKTVVLINGGSASGSEIVAGALQDHGVATVVGEKSFGKGSVQRVIGDFEDGSAIKLTVAKWLTPGGKYIDHEGIKPDIEIELAVEDYNDGKDPQMDRAIEFFVNGK